MCLEIISAFENVTREKLNYKIGPRRAGDIIQIFGDVQKSNNELGRKANLDINEMMRSVWEWEKYIMANLF